jgi:hypothetical protein
MESIDCTYRSQTSIPTEATTVFVSLELSRARWLVTSLSPNTSKISRHFVPGGDTAKLLRLLSELRAKADGSRLIKKKDSVRAGRDRKRDFLQMKRHGLAVAGGEDEPSAFSIGRTDGAEDIGRCRPLIMRRGGACSTLGPAAGDLVLLPDAGFVLT